MAGIKVKAIALGFYQGILRTPETTSALFEIESKKDLGKWMVEVDDKGNPIEKGKGGGGDPAADLAKKLEKLKKDLATARAKGDEKGIAHIAGEIAKLDPEAAKADQLAQLKAALAAAETKKDEAEITRIKGEIEALEPSSDLT